MFQWFTVDLFADSISDIQLALVATTAFLQWHTIQAYGYVYQQQPPSEKTAVQVSVRHEKLDRNLSLTLQITA